REICMRKKTGKPSLTIVSSTRANPYAPPASLGKAGAKLWQRLLSEYVIDDVAGRTVLEQICGAADTLAACDQVIAHDGPTIRTPSGLKEHPLLKTQLAARSFIVRGLQRLGLNMEPVQAPGRPPASVGWNPNEER